MRTALRFRAALAALLAAAMTVEASAPPAAPVEHRRPAEQTFLTYPEWFLVYSPAEYAGFVKDHDPSAFPFLGHVAQFWGSYRAIWNATRKDYPFNAGYHVMIVVIGVSTTVEYALRAVYESLIGRLSEATRTHGFTDEDRYGARVAQEYVDFIRVRPWYEFDFVSRLRGLFRECPALGSDMLRKWERRYALTSEYAVKALYGWLIGKATKAGYEEPIPLTAVLLDRAPEREGLTVLERRADGVLATLPRYQAFTDHALALAKEGVAFREIAGNRGAILVTALVAEGSAVEAGDSARVLFRQRIRTVPGRERLAVVVPMAELSAALVALDRSGASVEHVYDY